MFPRGWFAASAACGATVLIAAAYLWAAPAAAVSPCMGTAGDFLTLQVISVEIDGEPAASFEAAQLAYLGVVSRDRCARDREGPARQERIEDDKQGEMGDAAWVHKTGTPNYGVSTDRRVVVHEVYQGRYQIRCINCTFKDFERDHFLRVVDERQRSFNGGR